VSASKFSFVCLDKEVIETVSVEFSRRMGNLDETFKSVRSGTLEKVAGIGTLSNMPDLDFVVVTSMSTFLEVRATPVGKHSATPWV
jgi:hypothetical protein